MEERNRPFTGSPLCGELSWTRFISESYSEDMRLKPGRLSPTGRSWKLAPGDTSKNNRESLEGLSRVLDEFVFNRRKSDDADY